MYIDILVGFIFYKTYCNSIECCRDSMRKEKSEYCRCYNHLSPTTQKYISTTKIIEKLQSVPVLPYSESISKAMALPNNNVGKTNLTINKCANTNSPKPDNYEFAPKGITMKVQNTPLCDNKNTSQAMIETEHSNKGCQSIVQLASKEMPLPKHSKDNTDILPLEKDQTVNQSIDNAALKVKNCNQPGSCGLLHYRKWWERTNVVISIKGKLITGMPIFVEENTLRVINKEYSYFIPLENVDYIRTTDGLNSCCDL